MIGKGVALAGMLCVLPVFAHTVILESGRLHLRGSSSMVPARSLLTAKICGCKWGSIALMLSPGRELCLYQRAVFTALNVMQLRCL